MYGQKAPLIRKLHKCHYCKRRLSDVPRDEIVAEYMYFGDGCEITNFFCSADCAREDYRAYHERLSKEHALNEYIKN